MLLVWIQRGEWNTVAYSFSSIFKDKRKNYGWFNKLFNFFTCVAYKI